MRNIMARKKTKTKNNPISALLKAALPSSVDGSLRRGRTSTLAFACSEPLPLRFLQQGRGPRMKVHYFPCVGSHIRNLVWGNLSPEGAETPGRPRKGWLVCKPALRLGRFARWKRCQETALRFGCA